MKRPDDAARVLTVRNDEGLGDAHPIGVSLALELPLPPLQPHPERGERQPHQQTSKKPTYLLARAPRALRALPFAGADFGAGADFSPASSTATRRRTRRSRITI